MTTVPAYVSIKTVSFGRVAIKCLPTGRRPRSRDLVCLGARSPRCTCPAWIFFDDTAICCRSDSFDPSARTPDCTSGICDWVRKPRPPPAFSFSPLDNPLLLDTVKSLPSTRPKTELDPGQESNEPIEGVTLKCLGFAHFQNLILP